MEKKEKVEFILEQMRLCIAVKDYIRTQIISKKINTKFFQEEGTEVSKRLTCWLSYNTELFCEVKLTGWFDLLSDFISNTVTKHRVLSYCNIRNQS